MNIQLYFEEVYKYLKKPDKLKGVNSKIISHYTLLKYIVENQVQIQNVKKTLII